MNNILVTGANGQLGSEIKKISKNYNKYTFFFKDLPELDICDFSRMKNFILLNDIKIVINCAAYTKVDKSEKEISKAENVNSKAVINIVNILEEINGKLIHISTDYVFDGDKKFPYFEDDQTNPKGIYGKTKLRGEKAVINCSIDAIVIRTSWLYSEFRENFVKTIIKLANNKTMIDVVGDQYGSPTNASNLAKVCLDIIDNNKNISKHGKIYHYSNEGAVSRAEFADYIIKKLKFTCNVNSIKTKDYPTLAYRPKYSVLNTEKIKNDFKISIPNWKYSLNKHLKQLNL